MSLSTHKHLTIDSNDVDKLHIKIVLDEENNDLFTIELQTSFEIYISELQKSITINTSSFIENKNKKHVKIQTKKDYILHNSTEIIDNLVKQINELKEKLSGNQSIIVDTNNIEIDDDTQEEDKNKDENKEENDDNDDKFVIKEQEEDENKEDEDNDDKFVIKEQEEDENKEDDDNDQFVIKEQEEDENKENDDNDQFVIKEQEEDENKEDDDNDDKFVIKEQEDDDDKNKKESKKHIDQIINILQDTTQISIELDDIVKNLKKNVKNEPLIKLINDNSINLKHIEHDYNKGGKKEQELLYHLKFLLSIGKTSLSTNMIYIVTEMMKFVEKYNLNGLEKKDLIISTLKTYLYSVDIHLANQDYLLSTICPELIDVLISVDSRKIKIRKNFNCFVWK
jgi:hypothetical protein